MQRKPTKADPPGPGAQGEVLLGEVVGVFGIRGKVRLHLHHRESRFLHEPRQAILVSQEGERRPVRIQVRPGAGKRIIGRIDGITTPEDAASLHGWQVVVDRSALPAPDEGEYYIHDLLGAQVVDDAGSALGELVDVVAGDRDVWVVATDHGDAWVLATPENIVDVNLESGTIVLRAGALDLGEVAGTADESADETDEA